MTMTDNKKGIMEQIRDTKSASQAKALLRKLESYERVSPRTLKKARRFANLRRAHP